MIEGKSITITGVGSYLPPNILTNTDLEKLVATSDAWIIQRTGIKERHIAEDGIASSDLAKEAAKIALDDACLAPEDIDLIIFSTAFPDYGSNEPRTAEAFKMKLGAKNALSLEEPGECAGFDFALARAREEAAFYGFKKILVACGDKVTAFVNKSDRNTVVLFGDGAGAVVLEPCPEGEGILASFRYTYPFKTDWSSLPALEWITVPAGGSKIPATDETLKQGLHCMIMHDGKAIMRFVTEEMPKACLKVCQEAGLDINDVKAIIPHSANSRLIKAAEQRLNLQRGFVLDNAERVGNVSSSSVPIGLHRIYREGKLQRGDLVITVGFGAGITLGANLIRWTKTKAG
jgi:3-oxoacyl-[acyl-carrier-protein] synthase III